MTNKKDFLVIPVKSQNDNQSDDTELSNEDYDRIAEQYEDPFPERKEGFATERDLINYLGIGSPYALQAAGKLQETCEDSTTLGRLLTYSLMSNFDSLAYKIAQNPKTDMTARAMPIGLLGQRNKALSELSMVMPIQVLAADTTYKEEDGPLMKFLTILDKLSRLSKSYDPPPYKSSKSIYTQLAKTIIERTPQELPGIGSSSHYDFAGTVAKARKNYLFLDVLKNVQPLLHPPL